MSAVEITERRTLDVERAGATVTWQVNEFDGGRSYMLVATVGSVQFHAHFDAEQWAMFALLIAGEQYEGQNAAIAGEQS